MSREPQSKDVTFTETQYTLFTLFKRFGSPSKPAIEVCAHPDHESVLDHPTGAFLDKNVLPQAPVIQASKGRLVGYGKELRLDTRLGVACKCGAPRRQVVTDLGRLSSTHHG